MKVSLELYFHYFHSSFYREEYIFIYILFLLVVITVIVHNFYHKKDFIQDLLELEFINKFSLK